MDLKSLDDELTTALGGAFPWVARLAILGDSLAEVALVEPTEAFGAATWPDMIAGALRAVNPNLLARNLGANRACSWDVHRTQVPLAQEFTPDLSLVICGGNDMLAGSFDERTTRASLDGICGGLQVVGSHVVMLTTFDNREKRDLPEPFGSRVRERNPVLRDLIAATCEAHGATLVDLTVEPLGRTPAVFGSDGIHTNSVGQAVVAVHVARAVSALANELRDGETAS